MHLFGERFGHGSEEVAPEKVDSSARAPLFCSRCAPSLGTQASKNHSSPDGDMRIAESNKFWETSE